MATRVTPADVMDIIDLESNDPIQSFIDDASLIVDDLVALYPGVHSDAKLFAIEKWLSAHFLSASYARTETEQTDGTTTKFRVTREEGILSSEWGKRACYLDSTGYLKELDMSGHKFQVINLNSVEDFGASPTGSYVTWDWE